MKIKFDSHQDFQLDALRAVVEVFAGQPLTGASLQWQSDALGGELLTEMGVGNSLSLGEEAVLRNVRRVQAENGLEPVTELQGMNFSVEMETGTGKTYVYLRTLFELDARYGWKKFIIVVPSVAIREGVLNAIELTKEHFQSLYGNAPLDYWVYDSAQVSKLRQFSASNQMQLMVMNIQAFDKSSTVIQNTKDQMNGRRPIEFIQHARPVVVVDEPQNLATELRTKAIESLNPLCTLRYSATHKDYFNLVYRLDPVKAYDLRLVKRIEVDSVVDGGDFNRPYIAVKAITATKTRIAAKLEVDVEAASGVKRKTVTVTQESDLFALSGGRESYRGYEVDLIDAGNQYLQFKNGVNLAAGVTHGGRTDEVLKIQVRETIREHLEKELRIAQLPREQRMKVLSLFFVDRVAHYAEADGKFRRWFVELYQELAQLPRYAPLNPLPVGKVHNGYFAVDKGKPKDSAEGRSTKADDEAYNLIMRDKERLLSMAEPLRFIFSHSALREGWDNPNVFQICTLREISTERERRQTIGRGLRLPVRENGERCFDPLINKLTVVASESFQEFAQRLQDEMQKECGVDFAGRILNKRERRKGVLKKQRLLDPDFQALWDKIKQKTRYAVKFATADLVSQSAAQLRGMPEIKAPFIRREKHEVFLSAEQGVFGEERAAQTIRAPEYAAPIPDLLGHLQRETELTRPTLAEILGKSERLGEVTRNPQQFLEHAVAAVQKTLHDLMVQGIEYERIANAEWEMHRLESEELESYVSRLLEVQHGLYDVVEFESKVEYDFAKALDARPDIKLFFKLPDWFKVETPLGTYNPDWAIVREEPDGQHKVYLVRETKGTTDWLKIPEVQRKKIQCGKAHFKAVGLGDGGYDWVSSASHL
ncbi:MAG: DEAD/DEAH box helicase family protein [Verrucomicrobia bacterium]|jgi:type III restriction enzyme|nr:DEAD/DEAH box helicase family protein [Verrucomicrobiota bacterium]